jgi:hypothetical protein
MNRVKNLIAVFAFSLLVLILPSNASAQWGNGGYGGYGNGSYNRNLNSTIKNLKNRSREFAKRIDRELDRGRYDGSRREDRLNDLAREFRDAADNLDDEYDNNGDYRDSYDEAQRVLRLGSQIDRAISRARLSYNVQNDWNRIRQDLQVLANAYNNGNYNRNRRNNRNGDWDDDDDDDDYNRRRNRRNNGDWRRNIPFPFPF